MKLWSFLSLSFFYVYHYSNFQLSPAAVSNFIALLQLFQLRIVHCPPHLFDTRSVHSTSRGVSRRGEYSARVEESSTSFRRIVPVRSIVFHFDHPMLDTLPGPAPIVPPFTSNKFLTFISLVKFSHLMKCRFSFRYYT